MFYYIWVFSGIYIYKNFWFRRLGYSNRKKVVNGKFYISLRFKGLWIFWNTFLGVWCVCVRIQIIVDDFENNQPIWKIQKVFDSYWQRDVPISFWQRQVESFWRCRSKSLKNSSNIYILYKYVISREKRYIYSLFL